jgi:hypothetical protein
MSCSDNRPVAHVKAWAWFICMTGAWRFLEGNRHIVHADFFVMTSEKKITAETSVHDLPISDALKALFIKRGFETLGEIMEKPIGLHMQYLDLSMKQVMEIYKLSSRK